MKVTPYLTFNSNCREAMQFYTEIFNAEIISERTFSEMPEVAESNKDKIMHMHIAFDGNDLMACDATEKFNAGNTFALHIDIMQVMDLDKLFPQLAIGGKIIMPLQDTFWGARFGMLQDKFGISWMLSCDLN